MDNARYTGGMKQAIEIIGFLIGALFLADILDIFIVGFQYPTFSTKWWILYAFSCVLIWIGQKFWKSIPSTH